MQLRSDVLDVVWGIFDEDGDGRLTKAEFMDVSAVLCGRKLCAAVCSLFRQVLEARASRGASRRNHDSLSNCISSWLKSVGL